MEEKNIIKIYTTSSGAELNISAPSTKQVISATNNRAQYYAEQAKKYREEARHYRDNAKLYAEQNSDVTYEYIDQIKSILEEKIDEKQPGGDYALREELPTNVSELNNDAEYVTTGEFTEKITEVELPPQEGCDGFVLMSDGENEFWGGLNAFHLFDTKISDKILEGKDLEGWALQGTYVYKEALAGSYYGYPDFYNKCLEEKEAGIATEVTLGETTITMYVNSNGHQFYDITDKEAVDTWFNTYGYAWFYGVDSENERILLPRNNYFAIKGRVDSVAVDVYGSGLSLGLTNGTSNFGSIQFNDKTYGLIFSENAYGMNVGGVAGSASKYSPNYTAIGVTTNPAKSGLTGEADTSNVIQFDDAKYLYICVGNTVNYECMTEVVNQGMDILEQVNQGIESRVNLDATNLSDTGKSIISSFGMPSDRYIDLTLGASGTTYTAPANGWFVVSKKGTADNQYLTMYGNKVYSKLFSATTGSVEINLPVAKGTIVTVSYNVAGATNFFRFVYAEGDR